MKGFARWWFLNGGPIYGLWKKRQYAAIRRLAEVLPKAAWDESRKQTAEECVGWIENKMIAKGENIHPAAKAAFEDAISTVRTLDMPGASVMEMENKEPA